MPGVSAVGKETLVRLGVRNVGGLAAAAGTLARPEVGWSLRRGANLMLRRADALLAGRVRRLPDRLTCLMPPRVDAGLFLAFDADPIEGRLAAARLSIRAERPANGHHGRGHAARRGPSVRRLAEVLTAVVGHLDDVDALHNRRHGEADPWVAHVVVYEPSEARDLQAALGRHLHDPAVRAGLLNLIRMFPPEPLQPDPGTEGTDTCRPRP